MSNSPVLIERVAPNMVKGDLLRVIQIVGLL